VYEIKLMKETIAKRNRVNNQIPNEYSSFVPQLASHRQPIVLYSPHYLASALWGIGVVPAFSIALFIFNFEELELAMAHRLRH
jgi:hypothetical protein